MSSVEDNVDKGTIESFYLLDFSIFFLVTPLSLSDFQIKIYSGHIIRSRVIEKYFWLKHMIMYISNIFVVLNQL